MRFRWGDALLTAIFIMMAVLSFLATRQEPGNAAAVVSQNGRELYSVSLSQVEDGVTIKIAVNFTNVITVREGAAGFVSSDCPDRDCVRTGFISEPGQAAVCLPNRVEIRIEGRGNADAVSG